MIDSTPLVRQAARDGITRIVVGVAVFDTKGRVLLLRRAAGDALPGLWELPNGAVEHGESPDQAALRELGEQTGFHGIKLTGYAGSFDYPFDGTTTRQLVFSARLDATDVALSPAHDAFTWRYADALPAISRDVLGLIRRIAPPKPQLDPDEWQNTLPRWHVGANALVRDQNDRILIVRPGRSKTWQLPGGQVDAHETPPEAAARELREETGLVLPAGPLIAISFEHPSPGWDHPTQILLFDLGTVDSSTVDLLALDPDIAEHRWVALDESIPLLGPARADRLHAGLIALGQGRPALITARVPEV
ncbi:NUDIX hydrolase [Streptomyces vietnamensis]|uniref:NUDIX hydrolase n=1 Tax=Streptomyces vietnamensis TaxID=362257 RepID=UPI00379AD0B5